MDDFDENVKNIELGAGGSSGEKRPVFCAIRENSNEAEK